MYFKVWGCRGSLPSPATMSFDTRRYGGNTTCFEIRTRHKELEELFIIDMGTGIFGLGKKLLEEWSSGRTKHIRGRLFITHIHLDHTFGMGFFAPIFMPDHHLEFYTLQMPATLSNLNRQLSGLYDGIQFPRHLDQMPAIGGGENNQSAFHDVRFWEVLDFETVRVSVVELNHPQGCAGWRFQERTPDGSYSGAALAVGTDTEHYEGANANVQALGRDADLLILDGQYEDDEYLGRLPNRADSKQGWGHSTPRACLREASECGAKRLGITHHDPNHDDRTLARMESKARRYNRRLKNPVPEVFFLREGTELIF
ncbi:MAG: MBL fold metallo-hydrolase [Thermodesulfobacteriota bacterium]